MSIRVTIAAAVIAAAAFALWQWQSTPPPMPSAKLPDAPHSIDVFREPDPPRKPQSAAVVITESSDEVDSHPSHDHDDHDESEGEHDHARAEDPTGDLLLYERRPMSQVPHHVVRGWGALGAGEVPGVVGAFVIVDPGIDDEQLTELALDIRAYHSDAQALSVRILDSERAARYDRHSDGGALAAAHLVGLINRNEQFGTDRVEIRGHTIEASDSGAR